METLLLPCVAFQYSGFLVKLVFFRKSHNFGLFCSLCENDEERCCLTACSFLLLKVMVSLCFHIKHILLSHLFTFKTFSQTAANSQWYSPFKSSETPPSHDSVVIRQALHRWRRWQPSVKKQRCRLTQLSLWKLELCMTLRWHRWVDFLIFKVFHCFVSL
jgi:hypothetical protein